MRKEQKVAANHCDALNMWNDKSAGTIDPRIFLSLCVSSASEKIQGSCTNFDQGSNQGPAD
jgi:hypothetical protein